MLYNIFSNIKVIVTDNENCSYDAVLDTFNSLDISSNIEDFTSICNITIPNKNIEITPKYISFNQNDGTKVQLNKDSYVEVTLGLYKNEKELSLIEANLNQYYSISSHSDAYDNIKPYFIGYISRFEVDGDNIRIVCEDSMYLFKKKRITASFLKSNLENANNYIINTSNIFPIPVSLTANMNIDKYKISNPNTGAEIFDKFKTDFGTYTFFRNGFKDGYVTPVLYSGLKYPVEVDKLSVVDNQYYKTTQFSYPFKEGKLPIIENNLNYKYFDKVNELLVVGTLKMGKDTYTFATIDGINIISTLDKGRTANDPKKNSPNKTTFTSKVIETVKESPKSVTAPKTALEEYNNAKKIKANKELFLNGIYVGAVDPNFKGISELKKELFKIANAPIVDRTILADNFTKRYGVTIDPNATIAEQEYQAKSGLYNQKKDYVSIVTSDGKKVENAGIVKYPPKEELTESDKKKASIELYKEEREKTVELNIKGLDQASLSVMILDTWNNYPDKGFEGSFTVFGNALLRHSDIVELDMTTDFGENVIESYYVKSVVTTVDESSGFIQEIEIGNKL